MRRSRIKAVTNVPVRRKAVQDAAVPELTNTSNSDAKMDENVKEAVEQSPVKIPKLQNADHETTTENLQQVSTESLQPETQQHSTIETLQLIQDEIINSTLLDSKTDSSDKLEKVDLNDRIANEYDSLVSKNRQPSGNIERKTSNATEPISPVKLIQNRSCFMRPIPRLDGSGRIRRNSIQGSGASASESEDDTRRSSSVVTSRVRNDSVCSVQSSKETTVNVGMNNLSKSKLEQKRRMVVSESTRKLAEARREFLLKHEKKAPDRSKLTMYDLIYYNPVTNPMKKQPEPDAVSRHISVCSSVEANEDDNLDEPAAIPVPQVKVGPDGQLIVDEQSLIIEHTDTKKNQEALANSEVLIDGGNGSGFYKRRQKSKEWSKWETLKFYKALNTVGTDFLLMQSLFPTRSRQEIKMKFKKEEKLNKRLVEKALTYHKEFDTEMLEKELATFEETEKRELEAKEREKQSKINDKDKPKTGKRKKLCQIVATSIAESRGTEDDEVEELENVTVEKPTRLKERSRKRNKYRHKQSIEDVLENLMPKASSAVSSDSEPEFYSVKPTRSGRVPKVRKLQAPDINASGTLTDNIAVELYDMSDKDQSIETEDLTVPPPETSEVIKHAIPDIDQVEPGSVVILSKESLEKPGKTILQVYMVSPNVNRANLNNKQDLTPVVLSPELLATVTTKMSEVEPVTVNME